MIVSTYSAEHDDIVILLILMILLTFYKPVRKWGKDPLKGNETTGEKVGEKEQEVEHKQTNK